MVGLHPKKHITCPKCYFEYDSVIGNNSLYICPKCNGYAGSECDYGFGSITPCRIYVGDKSVGRIVRSGKGYKLMSMRFRLNRRLKTGYKDLEVYKEAAAMVTEKLKK